MAIAAICAGRRAIIAAHSAPLSPEIGAFRKKNAEKRQNMFSNI
jgi:hypothetical protein